MNNILILCFQLLVLQMEAPDMPVESKIRRLGKALAIETTSGATHLIGIGNLRVMITNDDGSWFAHALEIDYAAQGSSLKDVKRRFERGLVATIDEHLKMYGSIEKLLKPAPRDVWVALVDAAKMGRFYSQISVHVHKALPFQNIEYYEPKAA